MTIGRALAVLMGSLAFGACSDPDIFLANNGQTGQPQGALAGTLTYSGPLPCTQGGHVLGAGIILAFDVRLLPPPDGFGTSAASFAVVPGDTLFASYRPNLTFNGDGSRWCPAPGSSVNVSAPWALAPLVAGAYQVRGFYDLDGNFDPTFSIFNLPTKGDIAGGAIDNAADVLAHKALPRYRVFPLGAQTSPGVWQMGPEGAKIGEIAVTFGLPMPTDRPIFYSKSVVDQTAVPQSSALDVRMPADFQLATVDPTDPAALEASFIRVHLGAGVAPAEVDAASKNPFFLPVTGNPFLLYTREDVDHNGVIDGADHVFDSALPSLYPSAFFAKIPTPGTTAPSPVAISPGLTIYKDVVSTAGAAADLTVPSAEAIVAVRPATICLDPLNVTKPGALVVTHQTDKAGNRIIADEAALKTALKAQFGRQMDIVYGCLPIGAYAMNLLYPSGQAWTTPNEAGHCAATEPQVGTTCGTRPLLVSQSAVLEIVAPGDAGYCTTHPVPGACAP
ncbi:MAG TPA: hypothetical protein VNO21_17860 [Polyangiaceae bacterium]|nr:hypothetical protein [Polyangiaceae bacterium]